MGVFEVVVVAFALAMDAFGVTISLGVNPVLKRENKIKFIISFAVFQFLFVLIGGLTGCCFDTYIASIPTIIGGFAIVVVGTMMLIEGFKNKEDDESVILKKGMYYILGISVSIDALVVGFTVFNNIHNNLLLTLDSILVGLITLLLCTLGFFLCRYARRVESVCKYADYLGGIILILFGLKMILL